MLSLPPAVRIFVATQPTNMHLSFDQLAALAREVIAQDPLSGHLFVFRSRAGDKLKILSWDRSGFCLWYNNQRSSYCISFNGADETPRPSRRSRRAW